MSNDSIIDEFDIENPNHSNPKNEHPKDRNPRDEHPKDRNPMDQNPMDHSNQNPNQINDEHPKDEKIYIQIAKQFLLANKHLNICHHRRFFYDLKHVFYKKSEAYQCSDRYGRLPIFSVDISDHEAKKAYIVTGYQNWWSEYKNAKPEQRYAYEVVLPEMPCHLYVDIEAEFSKNNTSLANTIHDKFTQLIRELRSFMYIMHLAPTKHLDNLEIIILDSSKPTKFSKHCIIHIPHTLFENNYYCGAFIRRFQIHILQKFGPKETNPFYIYPENIDKQTTEFKLFLIDMGVYTKGRDFRLLGSYKRATGISSGSSSNIGIPKRYLWIEGKSNMLSVQDFFNTLIQFQPKPKQIKYIIAHIVDTINGGIPQSSSLRTVAPLNTNFNEYNATGNSIVRFLASDSIGFNGTTINQNTINGITTNQTTINQTTINGNNSIRSRQLVPLRKEIINKIVGILETTLRIPITNVQIRGSSVFFNTSSHICNIKSTILKQKNSTHSKNFIFYILFGTTGVLSQSCFNNSYCFDTSTNRHRTHKIGTIRNEEIVQGLQEWCRNNGWTWKDDDFIIPNTWMGD